MGVLKDFVGLISRFMDFCFFLVGKFGNYFFRWLDLSKDFLEEGVGAGIQFVLRKCLFG